MPSITNAAPTKPWIDHQHSNSQLSFTPDLVNMSMYVMKRNGRRESVHFDKITSRIKKLCYGLDAKVGYDHLSLDSLPRIARPS